MRILRPYLLLFLCLMAFASWGQEQQEEGVIPSISEIIFPAQPEIRSNFNLLYEIHLEHDSSQYPSFWYKIIFNKDCDFEFSLFPINEEDRYDFFIYKIEEDALFCEAYSRNQVVSLNQYKYQKKYKDQAQSAAFRASLMHIKPIPVKAGDAIYLEVLSSQGRDCGHVFDCRTSESSLVTKVYNDKCQNRIFVRKDSAQLVADRQEELALKYLNDLFCLERTQAIAFTSINLKGKARSVKQESDFVSYSQLNSIPSKKPEPLLGDLEPEEAYDPREAIKSKSLSFVDSILLERARKNDSMKFIESAIVKSTRDLNALSVSQTNRTVYAENGESSPSRLQVDRSLFLLLLTDLEAKKGAKKEGIRQAYLDFRKTNKKNGDKRKKAAEHLKQLKQERKDIDRQVNLAEAKIKRIERLIASGKGNASQSYAFQKSTSIKREEPVYKIQIGVYQQKISPELFKGLSPVSEDPYEGGVRYSVGAFAKLQYAREAKKHVREIGLKDAFIVAYLQGKRISLQEAMILEL